MTTTAVATSSTSRSDQMPGTVHSPGLLVPALSLCQRELVRFLRQRTRIVGALVTPIMFWLLIGSGMGKSFRGAGVPGGDNYLRYFFPGTVLMILLFTAIFSTISIIEDRREGFLQSVLVAPVSRMAIVLGKVLGGTILAFGQGFLFLLLAPLIGLRLSLTGVVAASAMMFLIAFALTGLGFIIAWKMSSTQGFHAIMNLFLMPLWFLSGALFPPQNAWGGLRWLMQINPLSYGLAGIWRAIYLGDPAQVAQLPGWAAIVAVSAAFAALMFLLASAMAGAQRRRGLAVMTEMGRNQKIITTALWGALVLVMVGVVVGQFWPPRRPELRVQFPAATFSLVDQSGKPFTSRDLNGHPYIATFIFTRCGQACPLITSRMAQLQKLTPRGVKLLSFSVDPEYDTPPILEKYGKQYGADDSRWHFLTGSHEQLFEVASAMKVTAKSATAADPILHDSHFLLVDGSGNVRGIYDSADPQSVQQIASDARFLESQG